jgi:oligopeptidase B
VLDHRGGIVPVSFSSFVTPRTIDEHDASTGESLCRSRHEVEGHEPNAYRVERLHAPGRDGIPIPVSLLRSAHQGVPGPVLLKGYGAYGFSQDAEFDPALLRLVDRGVMFALAHVRGGGELGAPWHDAARRRSKHVSVEDFVSVAEHLVVSGVAMPDRLVIVGRSAGGTLVAAALNARPDLFAGVVAMVPLADLMDCQSDESMPFSINERQEWGDPVADELDRERLSALCPTTNATDSPSPPVLATAAIHDGQVRYWQPATWVEALREARGGGGDPVLLHVSTEGGHHGPSRREAAVELVALEHAFTLDRLGLTSGS